MARGWWFKHRTTTSDLARFLSVFPYPPGLICFERDLFSSFSVSHVTRSSFWQRPGPKLQVEQSFCAAWRRRRASRPLLLATAAKTSYKKRAAASAALIQCGMLMSRFELKSIAQFERNLSLRRKLNNEAWAKGLIQPSSRGRNNA